ncbi:uncharacterized protein LOC143282822 [Babylonia areolata]|uniref:uncharacterized protein LOC143282822 n=1 Tax=Babylonia areolata TaxID=304850 RepID=UPI003FD47891
MWGLVLAVSVCTIGVVFWAIMPDPTRRCGVYVEPNKWYPFKYAFFRILLWLRRRKNRSMKQTTGEGAGYGVRSRSSPEEMDRVQPLPKDQPLAVDAVYFNGGDAEGNYMVAATARRHNNLVQTILLFRFADMGILEMPNMPDTSLYTKEPNDAFAAAGLRLEPVVAMKKWKLTYQGKMRLRKERKEVEVKFSLDWDSFTRFFDFDTDMHPATMADGIAREKWSREYFDNLQKAHQTHYEQFGVISGSVEIEGHGTRQVNMRGVRDHSYGNIRDWKSLHRYALQYLCLEDGSAMCVGAISMPSTISRLTVGYVFHPDGSMDAVSCSEFELFEHGEDGRPPPLMAFNFSAGGKVYELECKVLDCPIFYMGENWDAKIYERFCQYYVNGVKGWGISEWDYCNHVGKETEQEWYNHHET